MCNKKELRKEIIGKRDNISLNPRKLKNKKIYSRLIESQKYKDSNMIFVFVSYNSEVSTHDIIIQGLKDGKRICVPKVIDKTRGMKAIEIKSFGDLKEGFKGILEPEFREDLIVDEKDIDLAIVPGVAFDCHGGRLGYGGGFYDRFLPLLNPKCNIIGLCYKEQIIEKVPMEEEDVKINCIITE